MNKKRFYIYDLDGPSRVRIVRMRKSESPLEHGEILRCDSDGNPSPVYTWLEANTGDRLHAGQQLTFDVCQHLKVGTRPASQSAQTSETISLRCVAFVSGNQWKGSDFANATYFVDTRNYARLCGKHRLLSVQITAVKQLLYHDPLPDSYRLHCV